MALLACLLLTGLLYGYYAATGGFIHDDWSLLQADRFGGNGAESILGPGPRPGYYVYVSAMYALFGLDPSGYLASAAALAALSSFALFALLRLLGLGRAASGAIAALSLAAPTADSTRLWFAAAPAQLAVVFLLLGIIVALHGLRLAGRRAVAVHFGAIGCYALALLTYEIVAGVILVVGVLYVLHSAWRAARWRWALDVVAAGVALGFVGAVTNKTAATGAAALMRQTALLAGQSLALVGSLGVVPRGTTRTAQALERPLTVLVLMAIVATVVLAVRLVRDVGIDDPRRAALRRWLAFLGGAIVAIGCSYLLLVPSTYAPLGRGIENRVNLLAAPALILALYALVMLMGLVIFGHRGAGPATAVAMIAALVLFGGYTLRLFDDESAYRRSHNIQQHALKLVASRVPRPPPRTVIYGFGLPKETAPGVPLFNATWDLEGALRLLWSDPTLAAIPESTLTDLTCGPTGLQPSGKLFRPGHITSYGAAMLVDLRTGRVSRVPDVVTCRRILPSFRSLSVGTP